MRQAYFILCFLLPTVAPADSPKELTETVVVETPYVFRLRLETAGAWQTRNEFRLPGKGGSAVDLSDHKSGPFFAPRLEGDWRLSGGHGLRFLIAPLAYSVSYTAPSPLSIRGQNFAAGSSLTTRYKFNSYRLSYRYEFEPSGPWRFRLGVTAKIRDADIETTDGTVTVSDPNLGFVPLVYFGVRRDFGENWFAEIEGDALAAPQGRAEDIAVKLGYEASPWDFALGYRVLEGGADNDRVFTFAFLHYALVSAGYSF